MTARNYSAPLAHSSDADFRAWGSQLSDELTTCGLPKSADTGQVDWLTVAKPGTNAYVYEIRYLNDSLHGSAPCYIKIEYGTYSTAYPALQITCGTGTNGAGTITGVMFTRQYVSYGNAPSGGTYPTYLSVQPGYFMLSWARRAYANVGGYGFFSVSRIPDTAGDPSSDGFLFYYSSSDSLNRKIYRTSEVADSKSFCFFPGTATTTLVAGEAQVMRHFCFAPDVRVVPGYLGFMSAEIGNESTFAATPVGVTSRTYLALGNASTGGPVNCSLNNVASHALAVWFE